MSIQMVFDGDEPSIPVLMLPFFLIPFEAVYRAVELSGESPSSDAPKEVFQSLWDNLDPKIFHTAIRHFHHPYPYFWYDDEIIDKKYLEQSTLSITAINKNSPLELVLCGSAAALTAAVILSGGSIDFSLKGVKCRLPPLGKGIEALKRALRKKL